jgi:hypothetical protein
MMDAYHRQDKEDREHIIKSNLKIKDFTQKKQMDWSFGDHVRVVTEDDSPVSNHAEDLSKRNS